MINNLTINRSSESRRATTYGLSHKSGFTMVKTRIQTSDFDREMRMYSRQQYLKTEQNRSKDK